jgi:hypothetical protein
MSGKWLGCERLHSSRDIEEPQPTQRAGARIILAPMLYDHERHEPLAAAAWDEGTARAAIERIALDAVEAFSPETYWPWHPKDVEPGDDLNEPALPLYHGAAGVLWGLRYLRDAMRAAWDVPGDEHLDALIERNRRWLATLPNDETASFMFGETPLLLMMQGREPTTARADRIAELIERNIHHPARELMWGSPGTLLAALFLYERFGDARWAELFLRTAEQLWSELEWSERYECSFWTQDMYGRRSTYLDAVHGFVATACVLIRGRALLTTSRWRAWEQTIATTIERSAVREDGLANWLPELTSRENPRAKFLMQYCHGAPGFVICLAQFPSHALDELLLAAGEATWIAGPLSKGSNLCHGTGGNGYAFLKLYERTHDAKWLERARAFAMHGIAQMEADRRHYGQSRYSLWTGDMGFAIYLWDCIRARAAFPTLDVFYK